MPNPAPLMPSLEAGFAHFHHSIDSGIRTLLKLGVSPSSITIQMAGRGHPSGQIVSQSPKPGVPLVPGVTIQLSVSGLGYFNDLPVGMWDSGGEDQPGTQEILEPLDDPIQKAAHWIREGAKLFDLQPEDVEACARWVTLFDLPPQDWPRESLYSLSLMLPKLQDLADTEQGVRLAFDLLLGLKIHHLRLYASKRSFSKEQWTLLGQRASRLGIDAIVGDSIEDLAAIWIVAGPVSLLEYNNFQQTEQRRLIAQVLDLIAGCERRCRLTWFFGNNSRAPRLGFEEQNARLGINSTLGRETWQAQKG